MKKLLTSILACIMAVLTLSLAACDDDKRVYNFPKQDEMQANLEAAGYIVMVSTDLGDDRSGTYLYGKKDSDYIEFFWLDNSEDCEFFYTAMEERHDDYNSLVQIENDEKYGNIVYCGTENAVNTAGITVVKVKV